MINNSYIRSLLTEVRRVNVDPNELIEMYNFLHDYLTMLDKSDEDSYDMWKNNTWEDYKTIVQSLQAASDLVNPDGSEDLRLSVNGAMFSKEEFTTNLFNYPEHWEYVKKYLQNNYNIYKNASLNEVKRIYSKINIIRSHDASWCYLDRDGHLMVGEIDNNKHIVAFLTYTKGEQEILIEYFTERNVEIEVEGNWVNVNMAYVNIIDPDHNLTEVKRINPHANEIIHLYFYVVEWMDRNWETKYDMTRVCFEVLEATSELIDEDNEIEPGKYFLPEVFAEKIRAGHGENEYPDILSGLRDLKDDLQQYGKALDEVQRIKRIDAILTNKSVFDNQEILIVHYNGKVLAGDVVRKKDRAEFFMGFDNYDFIEYIKDQGIPIDHYSGSYVAIRLEWFNIKEDFIERPSLDEVQRIKTHRLQIGHPTLVWDNINEGDIIEVIYPGEIISTYYVLTKTEDVMYLNVTGYRNPKYANIPSRRVWNGDEEWFIPHSESLNEVLRFRILEVGFNKPKVTWNDIRVGYQIHDYTLRGVVEYEIIEKWHTTFKVKYLNTAYEGNEAFFSKDYKPWIIQNEELNEVLRANTLKVRINHTPNKNQSILNSMFDVQNQYYVKITPEDDEPVLYTFILTQSRGEEFVFSEIYWDDSTIDILINYLESTRVPYELHEEDGGKMVMIPIEFIEVVEQFNEVQRLSGRLWDLESGDKIDLKVAKEGDYIRTKVIDTPLLYKIFEIEYYPDRVTLWANIDPSEANHDEYKEHQTFLSTSLDPQHFTEYRPWMGEALVPSYIAGTLNEIKNNGKLVL